MLLRGGAFWGRLEGQIASRDENLSELQENVSKLQENVSKLQEMDMKDRGTWCAAVQGVTKSQTQLRD